MDIVEQLKTLAYIVEHKGIKADRQGTYVHIPTSQIAALADLVETAREMSEALKSDQQWGGEAWCLEVEEKLDWVLAKLKGEDDDKNR